ncbi:MAG: hypothetical protein KIG42_06330 [Paludibacteraceae bacterium]|nr:hypothetical protein [Paludibacteraceae bacterium]
MRISFFKTPKPRPYRHKFIYYDPEKEERQEREERVNKELGIKDENKPFVTSIKRGSFRRMYEDGVEVNNNSDFKRQKRASNIRLLIIILILLVIVAYLYFSSLDYLSM